MGCPNHIVPTVNCIICNSTVDNVSTALTFDMLTETFAKLSQGSVPTFKAPIIPWLTAQAIPSANARATLKGLFVQYVDDTNQSGKPRVTHTFLAMISE